MNIDDTLDFHESRDTRECRLPYLVSGEITQVEDFGDNKFVRVKARLRGMEEGAETDWLVPWVGGAIEIQPNVGDKCIVGFESGLADCGFYGVFPGSNSKDRPSESMVLGTMLAAMYNDLVTQFNQLRSDMANHVHPAGTLLDSVSGTVTGSTGAKATTAVAAGKIKGANGALVDAKSGDQIALSSKGRVR